MKALITPVGQNLIWLNGGVKVWLLCAMVFALGRFRLGCAYARVESVIMNDPLAHNIEPLWIEVVHKGGYRRPKPPMDLEKGGEIKTRPGASALSRFNDGSEVVRMSQNHIKMGNPSINIGAYARLESVIIDDRLARIGEPLLIEVIREGAYLTPKLYMDLEKGDEIKTPPGVSAFITFNDGSEIITMPQSHIEIENPTIFVRLRGIIARLKARFRVKTQYVTAGVRGTHFIVYVDKDNRSIVKMIDGSLVLTSNKNCWPPVSLRSGQQAKTQGEQEPEVQPIPREEYNQMVESINALRAKVLVAHGSPRGGGRGWPTYTTARRMGLPINNTYIGSPYVPVQTPPPIIIPEPATVLLLSLGGFGLLRKRGA